MWAPWSLLVPDESWYVMSSEFLVISVTCMVATLSALLYWHARGGLFWESEAREFNRRKLQLYGAVNALWLTALVAVLARLPFATHIDFCAPLPNSVRWLFVLYYASRFFEFTDVFTFGSVTKIWFHPHFHIHHCTTPILCYVLWLYPRINGLHFMAANVAMHLMICLHFTGASASWPWFRPLVRGWGFFQLYLGMSEGFMAFFACGIWDRTHWISQGVPMAFYLLYFVLFIFELSCEPAPTLTHRRSE